MVPGTRGEKTPGSSPVQQSRARADVQELAGQALCSHPQQMAKQPPPPANKQKIKKQTSVTKCCPDLHSTQEGITSDHNLPLFVGLMVGFVVGVGLSVL